MVLSLTALCVNCQTEAASTDVINVEDTDDEFIIKKPQSTDQAYDKFLEELYRHDEGKKTAAKSKRDAEVEDESSPGKLSVEPPQEFEIPAKPPTHVDGDYDQFLSHLYRNDEQKQTRSKRMIVFRHDFVRAPPSD